MPTEIQAARSTVHTGVFANAAFDAHEAVHYFADAASGLRAIIAVHSSELGPAAGGCRCWHYESDAAALTDALRLARGMSFKNALAGLPLGGGKAVILRATKAPPGKAVFTAFGHAVESLAGRYITAEDVGTRVADMQEVARVTRYVSGLAADGQQAAGGDPSPLTALGVFLAMQESWRFCTGATSLAGVRVAVQGCGGVGAALCRLLHAQGATLVVADVATERAAQLAQELGAQQVSSDEVLDCEVDILSPCALGAVLDASQIARLRTRVVCGAANNQLAACADGDRLRARDILYAPDYIVNAGGIISVALEYFRSGSQSDVLGRIGQIPFTLRRVLEMSATEGCATSTIADRLAVERIDEVRRRRLLLQPASC